MTTSYLQIAKSLAHSSPKKRTASQAVSITASSIDTLVTRAARLAFRSQRKLKGEGSCPTPIVGAWKEQLAIAQRDPMAFYPEPPAILPPLARQTRAKLPGGTLEECSFASYYATRSTALELLRRYPENSRCFVRHYRHHHDRSPAVICLHGWGSGNAAFDDTFFRAQWLFQRGFDVYLPLHPYHGQRRPRKMTYMSAQYPGPDIPMTNEGLLQAVWEIRVIIDRHQRRASGPIGIIGMSLGGYLTALVASISTECQFAIPIMPVVDLSAAIWRLAGGPNLWSKRVTESFRMMCDAMRIHSPLAHQLAVDPKRVLIVAGLGDRVATPEHAAALHEHWNESSIHWFSGGHMVQLGRRDYWSAIEHLLSRATS